LLHERQSVSPTVGGEESGGQGVAANEEAIRAESRRRKEEARQREMEEMRRIEKERNSLWNWIRGK
jgi:hypothetical protein